MKALDLYKFIAINSVEWHPYKEDDIIIFINIYLIEEFYQMLSKGVFEDEGIECNMKDGYFAFHMKYICEYHGIDPKEVFTPEAQTV